MKTSCTESRCWNLRIILKCYRYTPLSCISVIIVRDNHKEESKMSICKPTWMWKWQCTRERSSYTAAFDFCTLIFYLRGETCHLQITWTVSSDVRRLCFILSFFFFALWKDTLLPFVNLKLIYFVFSKSGKTVYCVVLSFHVYNLNELFTFHGMAMPIFIIIYCFEINFQGNKRFFASFLRMNCWPFSLTSGETS